MLVSSEQAPDLAGDIETCSTKHTDAISSAAFMRLKLGCACLAILMCIGFVVFITFYMNLVNADKIVYQYSSPVSILWMGLGCFWLCTMELLWWLVYRNSPIYAHRFWVIFNTAFAVMGFICLASFASSKAEGDAAAAALLWIAVGIVGAITAFAWTNGIHHQHGSSTVAEQRPSCARSCMSCLCSCRAWLLGFGMLFLLFFSALTLGVTIQAAAAARDYAVYPPPGTAYKVTMRGVSLQMHLHCIGANTSGRATAVFAHGITASA